MDNPIKIGITVPHTGPAAVAANAMPMVQGVSAWLAHYNEQGGHRGRRVELIDRDNGYDIAVTAEALRELVEIEGVTALLCANGTPQLTAALPYLKEKRIPLLLPMAGADLWYHPPRWGVYGAQPPFDDVGYLLGQWAARKGHRRVAVFYPHYPEISVLMAQQAVAGFEAAKAAGAEIAKVEVQLGSTDGPSMAAALSATQADAIIILTNYVELIAALHELKAQGDSPALYSWTSNVSEHVAELGGDLLDGMFGYSQLLVSADAETVEAEFFRTTLKRYCPDAQPGVLNMTSFAYGKAFTAALDRIDGAVSADTLVAAFESLNQFETGLIPPISFSPQSHMGAGAVQPMQLRGGKWVPVGSPEVLPLEEERTAADTLGLGGGDGLNWPLLGRRGR